MSRAHALPLRELLPLVREVIARGGELEIVASGASMSPSIRAGDRVTLAPLDDPKPGEVVLADQAGTPRLHRLIRIDGEQFVLRGDACAEDDPPVRREALVARVREVRPDPRWRRLARSLMRVLRSAVSGRDARGGSGK